ncbi:hypothetical protein B296_00053587 [Ensete ventricosum]|uniref:Uncharacterized protein n=1 Tax=Ensete ventricosum TaxID=4639 RepID=A0A426X225_ENSVE|nr:hypothetical protein B296_00053587 [Ensete ventricosum]
MNNVVAQRRKGFQSRISIHKGFQFRLLLNGLLVSTKGFQSRSLLNGLSVPTKGFQSRSLLNELSVPIKGFQSRSILNGLSVPIKGFQSQSRHNGPSNPADFKELPKAQCRLWSPSKSMVQPVLTVAKPRHTPTNVKKASNGGKKHRLRPSSSASSEPFSRGENERADIGPTHMSNTRKHAVPQGQPCHPEPSTRSR